MSSRRSMSRSSGEIHINPYRPKTPVLRATGDRKSVSRSSVSPSVQEDLIYETHTDGSQSETMIFNSRENTPSVPATYGTIDETSPLLNERSHTPLTDSHSEEDGDDLRFLDQCMKMNKKTFFKNFKIFFLLVCAVTASIVIMINEEVEDHTEWNQTTLHAGTASTVQIPDNEESSQLKLIVRGPFTEGNEAPSEEDFIEIHLGKHVAYLDVNYTFLENQDMKIISVLNDSTINVHPDNKTVNMTLKLVLSNETLLEAVSKDCLAFDFTYKFATSTSAKEIWAGVILIMVYGLIIFELVHRTLAAILGSLVAVAVLAQFGMRPTLEKIVSWLDIETLALLFGMMIIVAIFSETGFFDYCALMAYKFAKGKVWPLITLLCLFSAVVSAFLDNVTTILLLTPVTIRLCEVLNLDPKKVLIAEVLFSNVGGSATGIGDPPNVIIISHKEISNSRENITFSTFTLHMFVGIIFVSVASYGLLRFIYRNMEDLKNKDPIEVIELRHEIEMWRRAAMRIVAISREEKIMQAIFLQKVAELETKLVKTIYKMKRKKQKNFKEMLAELEKKYKITDKALLVKSGLVLAVVILLFFCHSFIPGMHIGLGWIAIMGAAVLMVLADMQELETILHRVEWSTLIFFAALFSLMEALNELGLINWIGDRVKDLIKDVNSQDSRLLVAILLIIWVSAFASSFIDNIPYTTAMIPVLIQLNKDLNVPLFPMVLALAFGACLGGNGTLIGASANVVSAGIAEQHGYGFTFWDFFKVGFPMMLVTNTVATIYLLICKLLNWPDGPTS